MYRMMGFFTHITWARRIGSQVTFLEMILINWACPNVYLVLIFYFIYNSFL